MLGFILIAVLVFVYTAGLIHSFIVLRDLVKYPMRQRDPRREFIRLIVAMLWPVAVAQAVWKVARRC